MPSVSSARPIWLAVRSTTASAARIIRLRGRAMRDVAERFSAGFAADLDQKLVPVLVDQFGQRQIEARLGFWSGLHRHAEAGAAGLVRN